MLTDLHTHTHHSPDGQDTVPERVAAAQKLGLKVMGISDHVEINRYYPADYYGIEETEALCCDGRKVMNGSLDEVIAARYDCGDLLLLCGVELGQIPQDVALSGEVYNDPRVDYVIGSVHELPGLLDFYFLDYTEHDIPKLLDRYFEEVLALARTDCYDTLAHLTYPLRYLKNRAAYDFSRHDAICDEIFRTLIAKDKALELNGSGLKYDLPFTDPDLSLICRYHDMGGRFLTIGTDAHFTKYLGYRMEILEQIARDAGFEEITYFDRHNPVCIPLNESDI